MLKAHVSDAAQEFLVEVGGPKNEQMTYRLGLESDLDQLPRPSGCPLEAQCVEALAERREEIGSKVGRRRRAWRRVEHRPGPRMLAGAGRPWRPQRAAAERVKEARFRRLP